MLLVIASQVVSAKTWSIFAGDGTALPGTNLGAGGTGGTDGCPLTHARETYTAARCLMQPILSSRPISVLEELIAISKGSDL